MRPAILIIAGLTTGCTTDNPVYMVAPETSTETTTTGMMGTGETGLVVPSEGSGEPGETSAAPTTSGLTGTGESTTGEPGTTIDLTATGGSSGSSGSSGPAETGDASTSSGSSSSGEASETTGETGDESTGGGPLCGDGQVEGDEVCDDGNGLPGDECESNCLPLFELKESSLSQLPQDLAAADIDGDGKLDLIVGHAGDPDLSVGISAGDGSFNWKTFASPALQGASWVLVGKYVGGEAADIILVPANGASTLAIWENKSTPGNLALTALNPVGGNVMITYVGASTGDIDLDGLDDLVFVHTAMNKLYERNNLGATFDTHDGYFTKPAPIAVAVGPVTTDDEIPDVVVAYAGLAELGVFAGTGGDLLKPSTPLQGCPGGASAIAIGDADHQGPADLVVSCKGGGSLVMVGHDGVEAYSRTIGPGLPAVTVAGIVDLYGDDNQADVFAVAPEQKQLVIAAQVEQQFAASRQFALKFKPGRAIAADFTGDGAPDIAVLHPLDDKLTVFINQGRLAPP